MHAGSETARAVVDAEAVRVEVAALVDAVVLRVDGDAVELAAHERHDVGVSDTMAITVPDVVEVTVRAGTDGRDRSRELSRRPPPSTRSSDAGRRGPAEARRAAEVAASGACPRRRSPHDHPGPS